MMARARGEVTELAKRCDVCHGEDPVARIRHQLMDFGTVDDAARHVRAQFPQAAYLDEFEAWWSRERYRRFGTGRAEEERRQTGLDGIASILASATTRRIP